MIDGNVGTNLIGWKPKKVEEIIEIKTKGEKEKGNESDIEVEKGIGIERDAIAIIKVEIEEIGIEKKKEIMTETQQHLVIRLKVLKNKDT